MIAGYVIDASVAIEYLLGTPPGQVVAELIESSSLIAPELMDVEVLSTLRSSVLRGEIEEARALMAIDDLVRWPVHRIPHRDLSRLAWRHYRNITAYDAFYVAAAHAFDLSLLTADGRLSRASGLGIRVQYVPLS